MSCNVRTAAVNHLVDQGMIRKDPFNGLYFLSMRESTVDRELKRMRNRYAFRYAVEKDELPGFPMVIKPPTNTLIQRHYRRDTRSSKQYVVENGAFFDKIQTLENKRDIDGTKENQIVLAESDMMSSMRGFAEQLKINIKEDLPFLTDREGSMAQGEALVDFVNQTIQLTTDNEKHLPEEIAHFWVMILKKVKPELYNSIMSRITSQPEYTQIKDEYQGAEGYTEARIQEEAAAHVIMNRFQKQIDDREARWWKRAWNFLKGYFNQFSPETQAAWELFNTNLKQYRTVVAEGDDPFMFKALGTASRESVRSKILRNHGNLELREFKKKTLEGKVKNLDILEDENGIIARYVDKDDPDNPYAFRATDASTVEFVRSIEGIENMRKLRDSKRVKMTSETGTALHSTGQTLLHKLGDGMKGVEVIDVNGVNITDSYDQLADKSPLTKAMYNEFKGEMSKLLKDVVAVQKSINPEEKVELMTEVRVADKNSKTAGTIDILFLFSDGSVGVYDFKFISPKKQFLKKENGSRHIISDPFIGSRLGSFESQLSFYAKALRQEYGVENVRRTRIIPGHIDFKWAKGKPLHVDTFHMKSDTNEFLQHIPVANELANHTEINIKLEKMYDRREELMSKKKTAKNLKELEMINKGIKALLLDLDLSGLVESINFSVDAINKGAAITNETDDAYLSFDELWHHFQIISLFQDMETTTLKNLAEKGEKDAKKMKENLDKMSILVTATITILQDTMHQRLQAKSRFQLDHISAKPGFRDKFVSMDEINNPIFMEAKDRINLAMSKHRRKLAETANKWEELDNALKAWGKANGKSIDQVYNMFIKDTGETLRLVQMYKPEFWKRVQASTGTEDNANSKEDIAWMKDNFQIKEGAREEYNDAKQKAFARMKLRYNDNPAAYKAATTNWVKENNVWSKTDYSAWVSRNYWHYLEIKPERAVENWSKDYATFNQAGNEALLNYYTSWKEQIKEFNELLDDTYLRPDMIGNVRTGIIEGFKGLSDLSGSADVWHEALMENFEVKAEEDDTSGGSRVKKIPLPFVNPIRNTKGEYDSKLVSRNLTRSMYLLASSIYNHKEMSDVESEVLFLRHMLTTKELAGRELAGKRKAGQPKAADLSAETLALFDAHANYYLYGHAFSEDDVEIMGYSLQKTVSAIKKYHTFSKLAAPIRIALATVGATRIFSHVSGIGGVQFNNDHLFEADKLWKTEHERYMAVAEFFQVYAESDIRHRARHMYGNRRSVILDSANLMEPLGAADRLTDRKIAIAMALNHGLDEKGEIKRLSQLPEGSKNLFELLTVKDGKVSSDMSDIAFNDFRHRVKKTVKDIKGEANEENIIAIQTTLAGKVSMQFKSWLPGTLSARFGSMRYDPLLDELKEGRFIGFAKSLKTEESQEEQNWWSNVWSTLQSLGHAFTQLIMLENYRVSTASMAKLEAKGKLTPEAKAKIDKMRAPVIAEFEAMKRTTQDPALKDVELEDYILMRENSNRRTLVEARINLVLMLLSALFGMKGDDDKRFYAKNYATRRLMDLFAKLILETTFYMNPIEAAKLNRSAIPFLGLISDAQKLAVNTLEESARLLNIIDEDPRDKTPMFYYASTFVYGGVQTRKLLEIFPQDKQIR